MARTKSTGPVKPRSAILPENQEARLIAMAYDAAEQHFLNGTASSQLITHFLKAGTAKAELEKAKLEADVVLARAKTEQLQSMSRSEEMVEKAIAAFRGYSGRGDPEEYEDYEDYDDYEYDDDY